MTARRLFFSGLAAAALAVPAYAGDGVPIAPVQDPPIVVAGGGGYPPYPPPPEPDVTGFICRIDLEQNGIPPLVPIDTNISEKFCLDAEGDETRIECDADFEGFTGYPGVFPGVECEINTTPCNGSGTVTTTGTLTITLNGEGEGAHAHLSCQYPAAAPTSG